MDKEERQRFNLKVLARKDPLIVDVLFQISHAVVYRLDSTRNWEKISYEGPVFLTRRKSKPLFSLFMLNRLNLNNYSTSVEDMKSIQLINGYIIWETIDGTVQGLWVYEENVRGPLVEKIKKLQEGMAEISQAQQAKTERNANQYRSLAMPPMPYQSYPDNMHSTSPHRHMPNPHGGDIMSLLNMSISGQPPLQGMQYSQMPPLPPPPYQVESALREALNIPSQRNGSIHSPHLTMANRPQESLSTSPSQVSRSAIPRGGSPALSTQAIHGSPTLFSTQNATKDLMNILKPQETASSFDDQYQPVQLSMEEQTRQLLSMIKPQEMTPLTKEEQTRQLLSMIKPQEMPQESPPLSKEERTKQFSKDYKGNPSVLKQRLEMLAAKK